MAPDKKYFGTDFVGTFSHGTIVCVILPSHIIIITIRPFLRSIFQLNSWKGWGKKRLVC